MESHKQRHGWQCWGWWTFCGPLQHHWAWERGPLVLEHQEIHTMGPNPEKRQMLIGFLDPAVNTIVGFAGAIYSFQDKFRLYLQSYFSTFIWKVTFPDRVVFYVVLSGKVTFYLLWIQVRFTVFQTLSGVDKFPRNPGYGSLVKGKLIFRLMSYIISSFVQYGARRGLVCMY